MRTKNKKGISLIVLVITIIVMIILAAAIILSLSNSGIVGKANKAKEDSDAANLKEYVNVLEAEYELMTESERAGKTSTEYVNEKLDAKKYTGALLMEDGTLYVNLQDNAKKALKAGIEIGDKVTGYNNYLDDREQETTGKENTAPIQPGPDDNSPTKQTVKNIKFETWRFAGVSNSGELMIVPNLPSDLDSNKTLKLSGTGGYLNGVSTLNEMCDKLYSVEGKGKARSINLDDVKRILAYTGTDDFISNSEGMYGVVNEEITKNKDRMRMVFDNSNYWLANTYSDGTVFNMLCCRYAGVDKDTMYVSSGTYIPYGEALKPVVSLNSNVAVTKVSDNNWSI